MENIFKTFAKFNWIDKDTIYIQSNYIYNNCGIIKLDDTMMKKDFSGIKIKEFSAYLNVVFNYYIKKFNNNSFCSYVFSPTADEYNEIIKRSDEIVEIPFTCRNVTLNMCFNKNVLKNVIDIITNGKFKDIAFIAIDKENDICRLETTVAIYKGKTLVAFVAGI